ncbi:DUF2304 family protein [Bremerella sp. T1]|uniref:DUF2304 domain-containing protein n=1 Tax=Bremerella sp. TYQ1 TaxID=3119568 RepID=UPI001CCEAE30|nr:DUF2304 domain-containing protein [Bremerella volcania]UBM37121.1 DUF2304 domain-containing protein [Bremerella volcania]
MILFQWVCLIIIGCVLLFDIARAIRKKRLNWRRSLRISVWLAALLGILYPDMVSRFAQSVGIGRGADVILYLVTLVFIATTFYFYSRYLRLQRQITDLTRYLAIHEARRPELENIDQDC